jgi:hypothetical protein
MGGEMETVAGDVESVKAADETAVRSGDRTGGHPVRTLIAGAFVLVPAHIFVVAGALVLASGTAADRLPDGMLITDIGARSLQFILGVFGVLAGLVAGLAGAAKRVVDVIEQRLQARVQALAADGERLFPSVATAEARVRYDEALDRMVEGMLGRVRVPRAIRRLIRKGLEQSLVEDFLADCERRGMATIGATETRNWAIATGLPHALAPVRGQIRVWRVIALGPPVLLVVVLLLVSLIGTAGAPAMILRSVCGVLGAGVLAAGFVGARRHRRPTRWLTGMATVGVTIGAAPWVYGLLLPGELGVAWLAAIALTLVLIAGGLRRAFVSADRPD